LIEAGSPNGAVGVGSGQLTTTETLASTPYQDAFAHLTALVPNPPGTAAGLAPGNGDNPAGPVAGRMVRDGDHVWTPATPFQTRPARRTPMPRASEIDATPPLPSCDRPFDSEPIP
jgi:hypothetical protein